MSTPAAGERQALVASPLAAAGAALALVGLVRRSPVLVFVGALTFGAGLKLHPIERTS